MRPQARQKIYKFSAIKNLINFFTFGILNFNKTKKLEEYLKNILILNILFV